MKMKRMIYLLLAAILFSVFTLQSQTTYERASEAYRSENYKQSIELYEQLAAQTLSENKESAEIYYNLGNAYFRDGQAAKAILNY